MVALIAFLIGAVYSYGLLLGASYFLGAGHGPDSIVRLVEAPLELGLLVWPLAFVLALFAKNRVCSLLLMIMLSLHYLVVMSKLWTLGGFSMRRYLSAPGGGLVLGLMLASYMLVNAGLWWRIVRARSQPNKTSQATPVFAFMLVLSQLPGAPEFFR